MGFSGMGALGGAAQGAKLGAFGGPIGIGVGALAGGALGGFFGGGPSEEELAQQQLFQMLQNGSFEIPTVLTGGQTNNVSSGIFQAPSIGRRFN